ncbi:transmembrane emp24 domain-containing protein p24delta8-like [Cynara cardunculus var. scolymus]|uniref:transmembrane emp24 domain-containing protein p24delta8-like n=1 Tax=Cynara cardunculus var. scolymus TaxID=59895 RepID=UPI000D623AA5|nr:transmembrane emp24 domain-containing protein p24delta8-like [Cynara cardunculus var. scolymus]
MQRAPDQSHSIIFPISRVLLSPNSKMWRSISVLAIVVVILGFVPTPMVKGMRFDIKTGATKCITEDIQSNSLSVGKYSIINPNEDYPLPDSHRITVRITSPLGHNCHYADQKDVGNFAFTANEDGDYMACFWVAKQNPPTTMTVEFEWRSGLAAKDWSKVAKRGQLEMMEIDLKKLFDTIASIHDEMYYLREREESMQVLIRSTNSKMATFSFFSLIVCLAVAAMQIWHLKTFFERKKLI